MLSTPRVLCDLERVSPQQVNSLLEHEALLVWVSENKDELTQRLVDALEKLETSHPDSAEERDALSQIYRVQRRARR